MTNEEIQTYVYDINWLNNKLHDYVARIAFLEITEEYLKGHKDLSNDMPIIGRIYNSVADAAVLRISSNYDRDSDTLSFFQVLKWIRKNKKQIKEHFHNLDLDFTDDDLNRMESEINQSEVIKKFRTVRNNIVGHSNKKVSYITDIRRNLFYKNHKDRKSFLEDAETYKKNALPHLLNMQDFIDMKDFSIKLLNNLKKCLKMPDRVFSQSGNSSEWGDFYKVQKKEALEFYLKISKNS